MDEKKRRKQRGLALASSGLALALAVVALLDAIGFVHVDTTGWLVTLTVAAATVGGCWLLLSRGAPAWTSWDPHFVFVPSIATALLLSELIWAAPEVRMLVLVVWPVVLVFLAGYIDFTKGTLLSGLMTAGSLVAVGVRQPPQMRFGVEALVAGVFFVTTLFACVVLGSLRRQRLALIAVRAEL